MNAAERYLTRATRGLWGRKRAEARQELASHVFERTRQLMACGMDESSAQCTVLRELGEPEAVSAGMMRVHTLPIAAPALALVLMAGGAGLMATRAIAQVQVPLLTKQSQLGFTHALDLYVDLNLFAATMRRSGVMVGGARLRPTLMLNGKRIALPSDDLNLDPNGSLYFQPDLLKPQIYINLVGVARAFTRAGERVTVQGWDNPTLKLGPITLKAIGTPPLNAFKLYEPQMNQVAADLMLPLATAQHPVEFSSYRVSTNPEAGKHFVARVKARRGEVYGLITIGCPWRGLLDENQKSVASYSYDIAPVAADGTVRFLLPPNMPRVTFTADPKALASTFQPCSVQQFQQGTPSQVKAYTERSAPVPAVLYKLSSNLTGAPKPAAVLPLQATSEPE